MLALAGENGFGALTTLVRTIGAILSAGLAIGVGWRRRAKWEPSEEDLPNGAERVSSLVTGVAVALIWVLSRQPREELLVVSTIVFCVLAVVALLTYGYLIHVYTYRSSSGKPIVGGGRLTLEAQKKLPRLHTIQALLNDARRDPDRVWERQSRGRIKMCFTLAYIVLTVAGSLAITCVAVLILRTSTLPDTSPTNDAQLNEPAPPKSILGLKGVLASPTLSPDSQRIAFVWNGGHGPDLHVYVEAVEEGEPRRLTSTPERETSVSWCPGINRIAFTREGRGVFWITPDGTQEQRLASVDGRALNCGRIGNQMAVVAATRIKPGDPYSIVTIDPFTGKTRLLLEPWDKNSDESKYIHGLRERIGDVMVLSPKNGNALAFVRWAKSGSSDLYLFHEHQVELERVTHDDGEPCGMAWLPDASAIIDCADRTKTTSKTGLWLFTLHNGNASPKAVLPGVAAREPTIEPLRDNSGFRLAYVFSQASIFNIARVDLRSLNQGHQVVPTVITASNAQDLAPQVSQDSASLAFASDRKRKMQLYISDARGNTVHEIPVPGEYNGSPRWCSDNHRLAFDSRIDGNRDIYVTDSDGTPPIRVTTETDEEARPSWSKDCQWIYFMSDRAVGSDRKAQRIWKIRPNGENAMVLSKTEGFEPFESPDGKRVFFVRANEDGLWEVPSQGGEAVVLTGRSGEPISARQGHWGVCREGVFFLDFSSTQTPALVTLRKFDFEHRNITTVGAIAGDLLQERPGFSLTADCSTLFMVVGQSNADLMYADFLNDSTSQRIVAKP